MKAVELVKQLSYYVEFVVSYATLGNLKTVQMMQSYGNVF